MGLTGTLQPHLDAIEQEQTNTAIIREHLTAVQTICTPALEEARHFYISLTV
jgi:hypothetical protein